MYCSAVYFCLYPILTDVLVLNEDRGFANSFFLFSTSNSPKERYTCTTGCLCANSLINTLLSFTVGTVQFKKKILWVSR